VNGPPAQATAPGDDSAAVRPATPLTAVHVSFEQIPRQAWDRLLGVTADPTPFAHWAFHRAWWDAYRPSAHEEYLIFIPPGAGPDVTSDGRPTAREALDGAAIRAIVPLMHRHVVEPEDAATATILRRRRASGTELEPSAKAIFFGASYHADYATVLANPSDLAAVGEALVRALAAAPDPAHGEVAWDVVDLRRLRDGDPALPALETAFRTTGAELGWSVVREQEDVCPVVTVPPEADWDGFLATLDKKGRHEIRRKVRRAEAAGETDLELLDPSAEAIDAFIELHQARFGDEGLFRPTEGGARSRRFLHRLAELERGEPDSPLQLARYRVWERPIFAAVTFDDGATCFLYNAGMDPGARELSPGVTGTAAYLRDRIAAGRRRFDFLRGDEPYKYEWGARDEPIHRLLVTRPIA
jgi:hypothetical protein